MLAFPKRRRIDSPETIAFYCAEHPACEVIGCRRPPMPTPHHIRHPRGDDVEENLIRLCWTHHVGEEGIHALGVRLWLERLRDRLRPEAFAKVAAVTKPGGREPWTG